MTVLAALAAECLVPITMLVLDVDGVLTDGSIIYTSAGEEIKSFHVRDGAGLRYWHQAGNRAAILSGRSSPALARRAQELGITKIVTGVSDKATAFLEILEELSLSPAQTAYVGDDLPDIPVLRAAGLGIAVADAVEEVKDAAAGVTVTPGGRGAIREVVEAILRAQGSWERVLERFA